MTDWMKANLHCVVWPVLGMIIIGMIATLMICYTQDVAARVTRSAPVLTNVFSMDGCAPCDRLKRLLDSHQVVTRTVITKEAPQVLDGFPACVYVDHGRVLWDNGERVRGGDYTTTGTVTVVHWSRK